MSVTQQESSSIAEAIGDTVHATAVVRLYSASNGSWNYENIWGGIGFVEDSSSCMYFKIVDMNNYSLLWAHEIYENFEYESPKPFFHTFEGDSTIFGLSFSDEGDARKFYSSVKSALAQFSQGGNTEVPPQEEAYEENNYNNAPPALPKSTPNVPPALPSHPSSTSLEKPPLPTSTPASSTPTQTSSPPTTTKAPPSKATASKKKNAKGGRFTFSKSWIKSKIDSFIGDEGVDPNIEISKPENFRHESHIGWDPENGFEIRNIPPQWRKLFQAAGVKKSELKDAETAKFIMDTVAEATMGINPMAGGPPPPANDAPPPPSGGPPPPTNSGPPPPTGGPPTPGGPPPSGGGGGPPAPGGGPGGIFAGLGSVQLKKVSENPAPVVELDKLDSKQQTSLADTLAKAMEQRRTAFDVDSDDFDSEDEWSD